MCPSSPLAAMREHCTFLYRFTMQVILPCFCGWVHLGALLWSRGWLTWFNLSSKKNELMILVCACHGLFQVYQLQGCSFAALDLSVAEIIPANSIHNALLKPFFFLGYSSPLCFRSLLAPCCSLPSWRQLSPAWLVLTEPRPLWSGREACQLGCWLICGRMIVGSVIVSGKMRVHWWSGRPRKPSTNRIWPISPVTLQPWLVWHDGGAHDSEPQKVHQ